MYNKGGGSRQQALDGEGDSDDSDEDSEEGGACDASTTSRRCCCQRIISEVKAFKEQMNRVEELFEAAGHACIFLPKYHPELNAIERFWGYTKSIERRVCDYSVLSLLARLPVTLSTVSLSLCRKWARVSWLYIYAYSHGLEGYLQTRDLKKWTNHRSPTDTADNVLLARGQATTAEERKAKEQAALAAAKEARKKSNEAADKMLKRFAAAKLAPPDLSDSTSRRDVSV
eukprot:g13514.t1